MRTVQKALIVGLILALAVVGALTPTGAAQAEQVTPAAAPNFKAPFPCGQSWTYSHHSQEVRLALDFIKNGGGTNGQPNLASAAGYATRHYQAGGAGNYVIIDHGGGWKTYYFHLAAFSVGNGVNVVQGQQIGTTGATGNVTGPHIHYEQLYNGQGQTIRINGTSLAPYPGSYGQKSITSDNGCSGGGKQWVDTFADAPGHSTPGGAQTGTLLKGTNYVYCRQLGPKVQVGDSFNHWWLKTDLDQGNPWQNQWVSAYYLARWGNDVAKDNNGVDIVNC
ncbi:M23 family metallopeptidase [Microlunatus speluncae]|uniref:M23 family metallopeptidase n=1 Tax=Microlunatus speluncae TaxID=2594267 RepID=UPI00126608A3|nr:M23 family metallopeptidase [Microlunatus speluncae]